MKIQQRLFLGIFLMGLALVVVGAAGVGFSSKVFSLQQKMSADQTRLNWLRNVKDAYLNDVVGVVEQTRNGNGWSWEDGLKILQDAQTASDTNWKSYMASAATKDEKYLASIVDASLNNNKHLMEQLSEAYTAKDAKLLEILATSVLYPSLEPVTDNLKKLEDLTSQEIKAESDQAGFFYKSALGATAAVIAGALLAAVFLSLSFIGGLNRRFGSMVAGFENGVDQISLSAAQIVAANSQAALGASTAAGSLEQTRASFRALQNLQQQTEDQSNRVARLAEESKNSLSGAHASAESPLKSLQDNSKKIAQKIQAVEQVAFQANILAMNAAVEAVRMGPSGKEFSLVSEEIRGLAQRCAELAREIAHWATENNHLSSAGSTESEALRRNIQDNQDRLQKLGDLLFHLEATHFAQTKEIQDLQAAFIQVEKMVQGQAHSTEKAVAAVDQMGTQSEKLKTLAQQLAVFSGIHEQTPASAIRKVPAEKPQTPTEAPAKTEAPLSPKKKSGWPILNLESRTGTHDAKVVRLGAKTE
jgi:methyl-accepting chemotaxis protein